MHWHEVFEFQNASWHDVLRSLWGGILYDTVVSAYIFSVPVLLLMFYEWKGRELLKKIALYWILTGYTLAFVLSAAHVVYYGKFYQFITIHDLHWFVNFPTVFKMIASEPHYWFVVIPFALLIWFFYRRVKKYFRQYDHRQRFYVRRKWAYVFLIPVLFLAMRGRATGRPLEIYNAFSLHNVFLNELKITPLFAFEKSIEDSFRRKSNRVRWMKDSTAVSLTQRYLHIKHTANESPVSRWERFDTISPKKNVVVVLMESMAAWKMKYFGNTENRTPFLDSLFLKSMAFTRLYSNGIHTFAGVYGTVFGYPVIFEKHPFIVSKPPRYYSMPEVFHDLGYQTAFFIPHNAQFDNLGFVLKANDFDRLYFEKDYPRDSLRTVWGVDDHFLLNFALKEMDQMAQENKPFMSIILTVSDHRPYYIPGWIPGDNDDIRATRFADWSLKDFMQKVSQKPWFDQTVFLFVADHGQTHNRIYKVPLTYNHIPALIYYKGVQPQLIDETAMQADLFPTLMHVLGYDFLNNTFGLDLLRYKRSFALFNHDSRYGVVNKEFFLIFDREKVLGLYHYPDGDLTDYSERYPELRDSMEQFGKAYIQTAQYILQHGLQGLGPDGTTETSRER